MTKKIIMGIDTSNYTTSLSIMTNDGELIANLKRPLPVAEGERGLRQSDAVFAHIKNLPSIMQEARLLLPAPPSAIGVSLRPRNVDGSYMPCFLTGVSAAEAVSASLNIPLYKFSHQCGHIMAAIYSSGAYHLLDKEFCAFHVSGGTTEMLRVTSQGSNFAAELVGGTADLNAGQVIDRIGTYLGLPFPSGKQLEELAKLNNKKIPSRKPKIKDMKINLSGLENLAVKLYGETGDKGLVAAFVLDYVEKGIELLMDAYLQKYGDTEFLFAGGVMSNSIIRKKIEAKARAHFALPEFSADNAVGIAELARRAFNDNQE